jgi:hypothetical protein
MNVMVRVSVTAEHLEKGRPGSLGSEPIVLALCSVLRKMNAVMHYGRHLLVIDRGRRYWLGLHPQVIDLMRDYACKVPVEPFTFLLQIPDDLLNDAAVVVGVNGPGRSEAAIG